MKTIRFQILSGLLSLSLSLPINTLAQSMGSGQLGDFQKQLRTLLSSVSPPENHINYLWEMSVHYSDTSYFSTTGEDTLNYVGHGILYEELYYMQYDTTKIEKVDSLLKTVDKHYSEDSIPLAMIYVDFAKTKYDSILLDTNYFTYDTLQNEIFDLPGRSSEPLEKLQVFQVVPLYVESYFGDVDFVIDTSLNLLDSASKALLLHPNTTVYVDFADSVGIRQVDFTTPSTISCVYTDSGEHVISVYVEFGEDTVATSRAWHANKKSGRRPRPQVWGKFNELRYGVYEACNSSNWKEDKLFILCGGFDDFMSEPLLNPTDRKLKKKIAKWYDKKLRQSGLADLRNHGYSFVIIDYSSTRNSVIDMGWDLAEFINWLKCETSGNNEQFVIMGTSYGARVAQFALSLMETANWEEEKNITACNPEQMHKTRLFISQEGPHVGDNIPLSLQHHFLLLSSIVPATIPRVASFDAQFIQDVIDSRGFRENTLYHVESENNGAYSPMPEWFDLHDSLRGMKPDNMGFPEFCKNVAVVNGMLTGERQFSPINGQPNMADGSSFLESVSTDALSTLLGLRFNFVSREQELLLNPNGNGDLLTRDLDINIPTLNLAWGTIFPPPFTIRFPRIEFNLTNIALNTTIAATGLEPICANNGGRIGDVDEVSWRNKKGKLLLGLVMSNTATGECQMDGRFRYAFEPYFLTTDIFSEGLVMNFGPLGSAIADDEFYQDFRNGDPLDLDRDYNANLNATFDDTPFDVIMGMLPEVGEHLMHGKLVNYETEGQLSNGLPARILNREVGDDSLYLENTEMNRRAAFSAAKELRIGSVNNPYYTYQGVGNINDIEVFENNGAPNNGIVSRSEALSFTAGDSIVGDTIFFRYGTNIEDDGTATYNINSIIDSSLAFYIICPNDYTEFKAPLVDVPSEKLKSSLDFKVFPNPHENEFYIQSNGVDFNFEISTIQGKLLTQGKVAKDELKKLNIKHSDAGAYVLRVRSENTSQTIKLIKQ